MVILQNIGDPRFFWLPVSDDGIISYIPALLKIYILSFFGGYELFCIFIFQKHLGILFVILGFRNESTVIFMLKCKYIDHPY